MHKHQCEDCDHIFEHEVPETKGLSKASAKRKYASGHMCPRCNSGPWFAIYFSSETERQSHRLQKQSELFDLLDDLLQKIAV